MLYSVEPGPNEVLPDAPWAWGARSLPQTISLEADLTIFLARSVSENQSQVIRRQQGSATESIAAGSDHIALLWAHERVLELMRTGGNRADAVTLASQYHLVTPVSGAVVLENKQQYDAARLTPVDQATGPTVPTVPEPHEWALIIIACAALTWLMWRHSPSLPSPASGGGKGWGRA